MYNSFDTIEDYRFSFGQYKGKSLSDIKNNEDTIEYLKRYRKKIKKELKNPNAKKYAAYNKRGLIEIENFLILKGEKIEKTDFEDIENIDIEEVIEDFSKISFVELLSIFDEKILENYDEKFKSKKFIKNEYKDYLCLRYSSLTYLELLEKQNSFDLIKILNLM